MKQEHVKIKSIVESLFALLCVIGIIYSLYNIINWQKDTNNNKNIKKEIEKSININEEELKYDIDWESLKKLNADTIAYLKVNNTNIDYVVVKGSDNSFYLKHNFNKEYNNAGWIFADYHNRFDGTDKNIIIYGHDTKDNSMFGSLKKVLEKSWYSNKENLTVDLVTENGLRRYQVFSVYIIPKEDYYINTEFNSDNDYLNFLNTIKKRSINDFNIEINSQDQILTLSTCASAGTKRVVLHAVLIK